MYTKIKMLRVLGIVMVVGAASLAGCGKEDDTGKKAGDAVDTAVTKTKEAAVIAADETADAAKAVKDTTVKAVKKTGEALTPDEE